MSIPIEYWTPRLLRNGFLKSVELFDGPKIGLASVKDINIDLADRNLKARLYNDTSGAEQTPALLFFHGGGFVIGDIETHDRFCRKIAKESGHSVLSVNYRKGPEHMFPAAFDDAIDSWNWLQKKATSLGIDPAKISLSGDSAGAALCLRVATQATMQSFGYYPTGLALIYPPLTSHIDTPSRKLLASEDIVLTKQLLDWFGHHFTGENPDISHPHFHPFENVKAEHMPPCLILTCGLDPLRDEGQLISAQMSELGIPVHTKEFEDMYHGFITVSGIFPEVQTLVSDIASFLKTGLPEETLSEKEIALGL